MKTITIDLKTLKKYIYRELEKFFDISLHERKKYIKNEKKNITVDSNYGEYKNEKHEFNDSYFNNFLLHTLNYTALNKYGQRYFQPFILAVKFKDRFIINGEEFDLRFKCEFKQNMFNSRDMLFEYEFGRIKLISHEYSHCINIKMGMLFQFFERKCYSIKVTHYCNDIVYNPNGFGDISFNVNRYFKVRSDFRINMIPKDILRWINQGNISIDKTGNIKDDDMMKITMKYDHPCNLQSDVSYH